MKRGFTLIELTVVLFILCLVLHLAVREMGQTKVANLSRLADRQLEEIAGAVYSYEDGEVSGFIADMGRLPKAVESDGIRESDAPLSLRELYACPLNDSGDEIGKYEARAVTYANLAPGAPSDSDFRDAGVRIPCGWGGPYIRLPLGASEIRDPWGNRFASPDEAGFCRIFDASTNKIDSAGQTISLISHLGADGMPDDIKPPSAEAEKDRFISFASSKASVLITFDLGRVSKICLYEPQDDKISGRVNLVSLGESQAYFDNVSPGRRYFKIIFTNGTKRLFSMVVKSGRVNEFQIDAE